MRATGRALLPSCRGVMLAHALAMFGFGAEIEEFGACLRAGQFLQPAD